MPLQRTRDNASGLLSGPTTNYVYLTLWIDLKYVNLLITSIVIHNAFQVLITLDNNLDIFLMAKGGQYDVSERYKIRGEAVLT